MPERVKTCSSRDACGVRCWTPHMSKGLSTDRLSISKCKDEPAILDRKGGKVRREHVHYYLR